MFTYLLYLKMAIRCLPWAETWSNALPRGFPTHSHSLIKLQGAEMEVTGQMHEHKKMGKKSIISWTTMWFTKHFRKLVNYLFKGWFKVFSIKCELLLWTTGLLNCSANCYNSCVLCIVSSSIALNLFICTLWTLMEVIVMVIINCCFSK